MKEIAWRLDAINERSLNKIEYDCKLHNLEYKRPASKVKKENVEVKLSDKQLKAMEQALNQAKQRKAKQYGR